MARCRGCGDLFEEVRKSQVYCNRDCKDRHRDRSQNPTRTCGRCKRKRTLHGDADLCRECLGLPPGREASTVRVPADSLSILSDARLARHYEAARAMVESGELPREARRWVDIRDEMEIRCQEQGAVNGGGFVYTWDRYEGRLRRRARATLRTDEHIPRQPQRVFRTPDIAFSAAS